MTDDESTADAQAIVDRHVEQLAEHFESVHVFVNRHDGSRGETLCVNRHAGPWFSRYGQIREWILWEEEAVRAAARAKYEEDHE